MNEQTTKTPADELAQSLRAQGFDARAQVIGGYQYAVIPGCTLEQRATLAKRGYEVHSHGDFGVKVSCPIPERFW
jgi:hypothetical protein